MAGIGRQRNARPVGWVSTLAEHELIVVGISAEAMKKDVTVIDFLALGNVAGLRIARVVKSGSIRQPGDAGSTSLGDRVREVLSAVNAQDMKCAALVAAI